jgi:hypothetical protein
MQCQEKLAHHLLSHVNNPERQQMTVGISTLSKGNRMTQLMQTLLSNAAYGRMLPEREISQFSAAQIRESIAELVRADNLALADALLDAGLSLYPDSEDILAIGALLAEVKVNWARAKVLMQRLMDLQGDQATPMVWMHWVRILRCNHDYHQALHDTARALKHYPEHTGLIEERASLLEMCESINPVQAVANSH